jgi:membrane fusion protein (multidrug efflux system)
MDSQPQAKRSYSSIVVIFIFLAALSGLVWWKMTNSQQGPPQGGGGPGGKGGPQKVSVVLARSERIPLQLDASATLLAWQEVQLMSETSGRIVACNIKEGSTVQEGQVLIEINDDDLRAQAKKQDLQATIAQKNVERLKELVRINAVSQQELDNAENQMNNIRSDLEIIKAGLRKTKILAPFSGTIGLTNVGVGTYLNPGSSVASLQQMQPLKVEFTIPEKYGPYLKIGDPVKFTVESGVGIFETRVYAFEPKIDPATRTLKIRARFENPGGRLMPGTFARLHINLREISNAVMVPTQCIIPETRGKKVVRVKDNKAEFVTVETGLRNMDKVQISTGILPGDTILMTGLMFVKPNSPLLITKVQ